VHRVLNVPPTLVAESATAFYLLATSLPFVVTTAGLRGLLEAHQHFGTAAALRVPLAVLTFASPLAVIPFSTSLVPIVAVLVAVRCLTWLAHLVACRRRYGYLRHGMVVARHVLTPLLRLGGWMTVSNVVSPLMAYVDRFFIGTILPLAAVTYYVTPSEVVTKLLVLPMAMIGAFFPAFAATTSAPRDRTGVLFERSVRGIVLLMFPLLFTVALFAREGLAAWVGPEIAHESAGVLRWLAVGVFINAIGQAPFAMLQGVGKPDLTAKLHLVELPAYCGALWWLTHELGIVGVAMAWTLRVTLDTTLLMVLALREAPAPAQDVRRTIGAATLAVAAIAAAGLISGAAVKGIAFVAGLAAFGVLGWTRGVAPGERASVRRWTRQRPQTSPPA
jgi:O-antigen/teichoic acid export membrane protein